jgi:hypothetical protein
MSEDSKHIEESLDRISKKEQHFSTPEHYFSSLEDVVLSKISEEQLPRENAYVLPDDYLENFEDALFSNSVFAKAAPKVVSLKSRFLQFIPTAAAACVLLFISITNFYSTKDATFDNISKEDLEFWFYEKNLEEQSEHLLEFIDEEFQENTFIEEDITIDDNDIIEYLSTMHNNSLLTDTEIQH